jgi:hypothetical protein
MSTNAGPYDTSRMYISASHVLRDEEPARPKEPAKGVEPVADEPSHRMTTCASETAVSPLPPR